VNKTHQDTIRLGRHTALFLAAALLLPVTALAQDDETLTKQVELEETPEASGGGAISTTPA